MPATLEINAPAASPMALELAKRRILLVDDDAANRQTLLRLLTDEGYLVVTAANATEALELTGAMTVDLVLLDLNMPIRDGWNTFDQLTVRNPLLPIIVATSSPGEFLPMPAPGVGALLEKPLNFAKLFSTIRIVLDEPPEMRLARWQKRTSIFCYIPSSI